MGQFLRFAPLLGIVALGACETMQGAGRDMQTAGALLTDQAANSQTQMGTYPTTTATDPYAAPAATPAPY
ncbi:entericidin A/B family lipoprotein [Paracoccus sp. CPCC 101403]|uniref:Entericidin A/B family lipoprotein n=2 Tax=Paracoccus broussonetiae TaxID=3075834 RepID=A0ABU3EF71_9RHOB|nr:entericidin A/B family lipoprotein [Paracoccus sp. CPCC 101403]MDT1062893.1 entericidin A/B family lipoprotein [Paracoccus sp. CPCC 101403]